MVLGCFAGFAADSKFLLAGLSLVFAVIILLILKKFNLSTRSRVALIYSHLTFLFFPFVLFSVNFGCGTMCMSCYNNIFELVFLALPSTLIVSTIAGFVVIPTIYIFSNKGREIKNTGMKKFVDKHAVQLGIKPPKLYAIDNAKPVAFSFRSFKSAIFLSIGLLELFVKRETEAVILHELSHIKQKSSMLKFSNMVLRVFSPLSILARFNRDSGKEEEKADEFVFKEQRTRKYLVSAKMKIDEYHRRYV